jgi:hypothetical protein
VKVEGTTEIRIFLCGSLIRICCLSKIILQIENEQDVEKCGCYNSEEYVEHLFIRCPFCEIYFEGNPFYV